MSYTAERKLLVEFGRRLYEKGFVAGTDGNLSLLVDRDTLLITPSGAAKGRMCTDDPVLVNIEGKVLSGKRKPSSEMLLHLFVYKKRPDVKACCHAHPPYATAFSAVRKELPDNILPEIIISVGRIPLTEYAPPGTEAVPKSLEPFVNDYEAFLLANHGVLTVGRTLDDAFNKMETVEHFARILYIAAGIGAVSFLEDSEVRRLEKVRDNLKKGNTS
ncbi:MAG: class II aldolase/adducin family protein [Candidatus Zixiibacteriota bacterium]|nr:MAG: class II aldolase/adducin family protein [candidate division Zixibacteria bacterium]